VTSWESSSPAPAPREGESFATGDDVVHAQFGEGVVIASFGDQVTVRFAQDHSERTLMANYAPLQKRG
jgi:DNA helicase-2/ATP-dependent DNA helicase PcrA